MSASTLLLVAANLLPIVGVVLWGWDAFVLLMLYWMETAVIAFWTIVRLVALSDADRAGFRFGSGGRAGGRFGLGLFFTVHAGIFMTVHFVFLWVLFAGAWAERIHGVGDFIRDMVIGTDLWVPLLFLFVVRGWQVLGPAFRVRLGFAPPPDAGQANSSIVLGLYIRIFVMQVTIILGGWIAMLAGSMGALVLLIVAKTVGEVFFDPLTRHVGDSVKKAGGEGAP